jgi:hypothetical protein
VRAALQELSKPYCGHCGYNLQGTGIGNRCPECGKFSDPEELVLWAEASEITVPRFSRGGDGKQIVVGFGLAAAAFGLFALVGRYSICAGICTLFAATFVTLGYLVWISLPHKWDLRGPYQVRLNSAGYGARYGFGQIPRRPWYRDMSVRVSRAPKGYRDKVFEISRQGQWLPVFSFQLTVRWPNAEELAHQIGDWIEAAPKVKDHAEREGPLVLIDRSHLNGDDDA